MEAPGNNRSLGTVARQAGASAAVGAALLLYFGFVQLAAPADNDLFSQSWWLLYHTLRVGGIGLALVSVWLWIGHAPALLADGIVSGIIGALLILTGIGMLVGGGGLTQPLINVLCGGMFVSAASHNARLYLHRHTERTSHQPALLVPDDRPQSSKSPPLDDNRAQNPAAIDAEGQQRRDAAAVEEPPPEGYLASLAKKRNG